VASHTASVFFFLGHEFLHSAQGNVDHKSLEICTVSYLVSLARMLMMEDVKL
jgi:hypothetical protein